MLTTAPPGAVQQADERPQCPHEELGGLDDPERGCLGPLEGDCLGRQLAEHDVKGRDDGERDRDGNGVRGGSRDRSGQPYERRLDQGRERRLADPPEADAGHGDAELGRRDVAVRIRDGAPHGTRTPVPLGHQLVDAGLTDGDDGELGGDEEPVGQHERQHGDGLAIVVALLCAGIADRVFHHVEDRLAAREGIGGLDPAGRTRLRLVRRLVIAFIIGAGVCVALLQFDSFDKLAGALLASGAVVGAIAGLAARQSLANVIAGVTLALTQPIRVGDLVEIGDVRGRVEDLTLTFTWLLTPDGRHIAVPNELLMTQPLRNDTLGGDGVVPAASVWIAGDADAKAALGALRSLDLVEEAAVDEVDAAGVRLRVAGAATTASARADAESALRERSLGALRAAGVPGPSGA